MEPPWNSEVRERAALFAVGIWVSYVTSCYVTSCSVCPGSSVALGVGGRGGRVGGGRHSISLLFENSILLIKVQGYRGMEMSIFEVLFFLTLLVYTVPHIMVFGAVTDLRSPK